VATTIAQLNSFVLHPLPEVELNFPETNDKFPVGELWGSRATVTLNGRTFSSLELESSTDYTGNEDTATWTKVADDADMATDLTIYDYAGLGDIAVPSGLAAVRIVLTTTDGATATAVKEVTAGSKTLVVAEDFTNSDGTKLDSGYTLDTGGNIDFQNGSSELEVQSNRCQADADATTAAVSQVDINDQSAIAECVINLTDNTQTSIHKAVGICVSSRVNHGQMYWNNIRATINSANGTITFYLTRGGAGFGRDVTASVSTGTDYVIRVQNHNQMHLATLETTGGSVLASSALFNAALNSSYEGVNIQSGVQVNILDDWNVWTY